MSIWTRKAEVSCCTICEGMQYVKKSYVLTHQSFSEYEECVSCVGTGLNPIPPTELFKDLRRQWAGVMQRQIYGVER